MDAVPWPPLNGPKMVGAALRQIASVMRFPWQPGSAVLPSQPWNRIVWPSPAGVTDDVPLPMTPTTAAGIPAVGRAMAVYAGAIRQMPLDAYRGDQLLPRPRLLDQPDPNAPRGWWVGVQVEDYLYNGNALAVITARDAAGWPSAVTWLPANWCQIGWDPARPGAVQYLVNGTPLRGDDVVHVRRGADRACPVRGIGIVEQYLRSLERVATQESYEKATLQNAAVPSVAVVSPNPDLDQSEADDAKEKWVAGYSGGRRLPVVLSAGTQVIPLAWSPEDAQLTEARRMALTDVANMTNLDAYYLGAPNASLTYQSPGANFSNLLRISLEPVLSDFEDAWSMALLPRGQRLRFERVQFTRDDFASTIETLATAVAAGILTNEEARGFLGMAGPAGPALLAPTATTKPKGVPE
jgi:HK97 family phage portal protein